jgi:hypothetical protein
MGDIEHDNHPGQEGNCQSDDRYGGKHFVSLQIPYCDPDIGFHFNI